MIRLALAILMIATAAAADTLMATRVVRPNTILSPADVAISTASVPGALRGDFAVAGLEAKITLYPGRPIMPAHVGPAAVVERNQTVKLVFRQGSLTILAEARALSRGAVGETVRVMNLASRNTVFGRVQQDGSVEVTAEGAQ